MEYFYAALFFIFGAAIGSFINVIADRYNTGLSFWKGRSFCFSCSNTLTKRDLFPIFSFLWLRGKCRHCNSKIPKSAFFTEILAGIISLLVAYKTGLITFLQFGFLVPEMFVSYALLFFVFATILLLSLYDIRHFIIPDSFLVAFFLFALIYKILFLSFYELGLDLVSGVVLLIPFLIIFLASKGRWIGFGDVKYIFVIGFLLGLAQGVSAVVIAFWIGAAFSLTFLFLKRIGLLNRFNNLTIKSEIPFGPFLSLGILISFLFEVDLFYIKDIINVFQ